MVRSYIGDDGDLREYQTAEDMDTARAFRVLNGHWPSRKRTWEEELAGNRRKASAILKIAEALHLSREDTMSLLTAHLGPTIAAKAIERLPGTVQAHRPADVLIARRAEQAEKRTVAAERREIRERHRQEDADRLGRPTPLTERQARKLAKAKRLARESWKLEPTREAMFDRDGNERSKEDMDAYMKELEIGEVGDPVKPGPGSLAAEIARKWRG